MSRLSKVSRIWKKNTRRSVFPPARPARIPSSTTMAYRRSRWWPREEQSVLHRQEPDHLRNRLARRVIIIRNDSSTLAMAMPRVPRVMVPASSEMGNARLKAMITRTMPTSWMVEEIDLRLHVPAHVQAVDQAVQDPGQASRTFSTRVSSAEKYRCAWPMVAATTVVFTASHEALQGEQVDQAQQAALRQHRERDQQQQRGEAD